MEQASIGTYPKEDWVIVSKGSIAIHQLHFSKIHRIVVGFQDVTKL
jgi:hypothetical protein